MGQLHDNSTRTPSGSTQSPTWVWKWWPWLFFGHQRYRVVCLQTTNTFVSVFMLNLSHSDSSGASSRASSWFIMIHMIHYALFVLMFSQPCSWSALCDQDISRLYTPAPWLPYAMWAKKQRCSQSSLQQQAVGFAEWKLIWATRVGSSTPVSKKFWCAKESWSGAQRVTMELFRMLDSIVGLELWPSAQQCYEYELREHASDIQRTCNRRNINPLRNFFPPVAASFEAPFLASVAC